MIRSQFVAIMFACSCAGTGYANSQVAANGDWEFSLSTGPAWRQSGTLGFNGGSRSDGVVIPSFVGDNALSTPPIGSVGVIGPRTYVDGSVGTDNSTAIDGLTSDWSYQNASQVDLAGDSISFSAIGFQSIRNDIRTVTAAPSGDDPQRGIAPVLQFDALYKREIAGMRLGFSMLLAYSPVDFNSDWSNFSLAQERNDFRQEWSDVYNLGGLGALIPPAPYTGAPDSPGFLLGNIPDSRTLVTLPTTSENALVSNRITSSFSADHTTFSFGPTFARPLSPEWNLAAGVGVSLHWLRWSASQQEQLTVANGSGSALIQNWNDTASGNRMLTGFYLQLAAEWKPADRDWSIKTLLRTDMGQSFSKQVGLSSFNYDIDGLTTAVMLTHPF
ncbi:MAG: hypothetical protein RLZZ505_802 [Verrucomicrobiota bacterium]|jgi:hypothetical protein